MQTTFEIDITLFQTCKLFLKMVNFTPEVLNWVQILSKTLVHIFLSRTVSELCLEMPWSPSYEPSKFEPMCE